MKKTLLNQSTFWMAVVLAATLGVLLFVNRHSVKNAGELTSNRQTQGDFKSVAHPASGVTRPQSEGQTDTNAPQDDLQGMQTKEIKSKMVTDALSLEPEMKAQIFKIQKSSTGAEEVMSYFLTHHDGEDEVQRLLNYRNLNVIVEIPECPVSLRTTFVEYLDSIDEAGSKWPALKNKALLFMGMLVGEQAGIGIISQETAERLKANPESARWAENSYRKHLLSLQ